MRILFAIPHYFAPTADGFYASERSTPDARAAVVRLCLAALWRNFAAAQSLTNGRIQAQHATNARLSAEITVALCTTGERHLAADLAGCGFDHVRTAAEPRFLGFECHKLLRDGLGRYDYFAYLEDDLRIADGLFMAKLAWFLGQFGDAAVLQPNRFEAVDRPAPYKLYIDGNLHDPRVSPRLQRIEGQRRITGSAFGQRLVFQRVDNPHAGCFFLSAAQLARWVAEPDFAMPSAAFGGPLESAATLGVMRHFRVYKPARENAAFLEIEHLDRRYLGRHFQPVAGSPPTLRQV